MFENTKEPGEACEGIEMDVYSSSSSVKVWEQADQLTLQRRKMQISRGEGSRGSQ